MTRQSFSDVLLGSEVLRFIIVGAFNTLFGYALYLGLLWLGVDYLIAYCVSLPIGLVVAFVLSGQVVFQYLKASRFVLYVLSWAVILLLNLLLLRWLVTASVPAAIAPILLLPISAAASYALQKMIVFRKPSIVPQP